VEETEVPEGHARIERLLLEESARQIERSATRQGASLDRQRDWWPDSGIRQPLTRLVPIPTQKPLGEGVRQLFGMIRKVFFARLGCEYAVAALNASESKMRLYALLPASIVPHLSTKIEP